MKKYRKNKKNALSAAFLYRDIRSYNDLCATITTGNCVIAIGNRVNVNSVPEVRILSAPPKRSLRRRCRLFFDKMGRIRTEGGSTEREPSAKRDVSSLLRHIAVNYAALQSLAFSEDFACAPLLLLFPTRPASLGSRGAPFLAASISYQ